MMDLMSKESAFSSKSVNEIIDEKVFIDWTTSVLAHKEAKKALCEIIEKKWKNFISKLPQKERCHIEDFVQCMKSNEIRYFGTERHLSCDHNLCSVLYEKFRLLYQSAEIQTGLDDCIPCLPASDSCFQYYWDLAMLFVDTETDYKKSEFVDLDISNLLIMMSNCQMFAFDNSSDIYDKIFKDRDELFHSPENRVSDEKMFEILDNVVSLLNKFYGPRFLVCEDVITNITQLKQQNLQRDYQMYNVLVEMMLKDKVEALQRDKSKVKSRALDEALAEVEKLLVQVIEINEEESHEVSELQEENNILHERIKIFENEREELQSRVNKLENEREEFQSRVKKLENERDGLQSRIKKFENERKEFQLSIKKLENERDGLQSRVDETVDIKVTYFLAKVAESEKEFLLLYDLLPAAIKRKREVKHDHELQVQGAPDSNFMRLSFDELASKFDQLPLLHSEWSGKSDEWMASDGPDRVSYRSSRSFYLRTMLKDCCKLLEECCLPIRSYPMVELIIPIFAEAFRQRKQEVAVFLNRQARSLTEEFDKGMAKLLEGFKDLRSYLFDYKCEKSQSGKKRLQSYLETSIECVDKMLHELDETRRFINSVLKETDEIEIFYEADIDGYCDEINQAFTIFENKWHCLSRICDVYVESAEKNKPTDV